MGGGDLNLKKSWHPSTLRNIERVWKAEQKNEAEQQKIEQLQKELAAERAREEIQTYAEDQGVVKRRGERLDWMYQGPAALVSRDDYLMGRKIDKTFEILQMTETGQNESKDESVGGLPSSLFRGGDSVSNATVDLANKIHEDPLFAIMKREKEQRKSLLSNPVRMKQLKKMLEKSLTKDKKRKKKSKKHRRSSSSSSSSSEDEKPPKKLKEKYAVEKQKHRSSNDGNEKFRNERTRSRSPKERRERHYRQYDDRSSTRQREYERSDESRRFRSESYRNQKQESKKKLSLLEKEKMRQEMMDNAKWRESQRARNVARFVKEAEMEDDVKKEDSQDFIRPMLSKATDSETVENRIKRKIFTIQRMQADMDRPFARR